MAKQSITVSWVRGQCIGRGSFGTVNLAFHKHNGAIFAVKSVDTTARGSTPARYLENEIRFLRSLSSPYVIKFLGDDVSYESSARCRNLHIEYLPGGTVADLTFGADVDEMSVRSYTWCVVSALNYIHTQGIVHCDVKGRNILVGSSEGTAKLADFGSAMEILTRAPSMPRGSPLWMAPEVIRQEYQGPESDVWSLGCTVIEMITGKPAWKDQGIETLNLIGFSEELPELPTQLSELGRDFVEKCLQRDPKERWSCNELLQHPFLSSASPSMITEPSPRCVLDWFSSEFEDKNDDDGVIQSANERVRKLATRRGANWESEGWIVVRETKRDRLEDGAITAYADRMRTETETARTSSVYSDSALFMIRGEEEEGRAGMEFRDFDGNELLCRHANGSSCCGESWRGGLSCEYEPPKRGLAVEGREPFKWWFPRWSCCNLKFLLPCSVLLTQIYTFGCSFVLNMISN